MESQGTRLVPALLFAVSGLHELLETGIISNLKFWLITGESVFSAETKPQAGE